MGRPPCLVVPVVALALALAGLAPAAAAAQARSVVPEVEVSGTVDPATARWVENALEDAAEAGAPLVVLRLDTPGGLDTSMRAMVRAITGAPMPVVVHVAPSGARAASAGLFVTQAADVAAMAPETNIGAATPVSVGGGEDDAVLSRKVRNDAVAYVRALAEAHGRDAGLAERMVRDAVSVTAARAEASGLVDLVVRRDELLARLDGFRVQGPKARTLSTAGLALEARLMPWHVKAEQLLVNPSIAYLLLLGGVLLVAIELLAPGLVGPGLFGGIALVLGLYGTAQLPVTVAGALLLLAGLALLVAELLAPGVGVLGAAGGAGIALGGLLLFDTDSETLALSVPVAVAAGLALGSFAVFAAAKGLAARGAPARGGLDDLVGRTADVRVPLDPVGQVFVAGALWRARTPAGPVARGRRVRIDAVDGLTLEVTPEPEDRT